MQIYLFTYLLIKIFSINKFSKYLNNKNFKTYFKLYLISLFIIFYFEPKNKIHKQIMEAIPIAED